MTSRPNVSSWKAVGLLALTMAAPLFAQQSAGGRNFKPFRPVAQKVVAPAALAATIARGPLSAVSVVTGDFFEDGHTGLITGYALGAGGVIGVQQGLNLPRAEEFETVSGFVDATSFLDVQVRPDLLKSIDFGFGHKDLVVGARGGSSIQVFGGDGRGGFTPQTPIKTGGTVESLATFHNSEGRPMIAAGVCSARCAVEIYGADGVLAARIAVEGKPSLLEAAMVNQTGSDDLIVGGEQALSVIDGRTLLAGHPRVDRLPVTGAAAIAVGNFVYDRRGMRQIGVLTTDGTIHTLARVGVDPVHPKPTGIPKHIATTTPFVNRDPLPDTLGWTDYEQLPGVAALTQRVKPLLLRSRVNGFGMDDLVALNVNGGKTTTIAHPVVGVQATNGQPAETRVLPARVDTEAEVSSDILAAVATRVSQTAQLGLIAATADARPDIAQQPSNKAFTVNTTNDGAPNAALCNAGNNNTCTLRSAIAAANADLSANGTSKADNIYVPPGTYQLTYHNGLDDQGSITYHIEIIAPVNILGTGSANSITITSNNNDKIFSLNSTANNNPEAPIDVYFSNLTLTNGTNLNNYNVQGDSNITGGLLDADTDGTGNFTFVNCIFSNGTVEYGNGGGLYVSDGVYNGTHGPGLLEIDGSLLSGNRTPEQGGAISTATQSIVGNVPILFNGDTFSSNTSSYSVNTNDGYGTGQGGALFFAQDQLSGVTSIIENTKFMTNTSVNDAAGDASDGGAVHTFSGVTMTNTQFINNTTGGLGGGLYLATYYHPSPMTGMTFTGNTAGQSGGAMDVQAEGTNAMTTTLQYSRITGNTAPSGKGSAIYYGVTGDTTANATMNAYPNFWGCNGEPNSTGCDTVVYTGAGGTLNTTTVSQADSLNVYPYVQVTATISPTSPTSGNPFTLTGNFNTTSTGTAITGANLAAFSNSAGTGQAFTTAGTAYTSQAPAGTATATLSATENSSSLGSGTATLNSSGVATASFTANAAGSGTGTVKIDSASVVVNYTVNVLAPAAVSSFTPATVAVGGTSTLSVSITNQNNGTALTGVAFSELLPNGLQVASTPALSNSCGGTFTAAANGIMVSLSGGSINASATCTVSVSVTAISSGAKANSTGPVTASNASSTGAASFATLTVESPITATQAFSPTSIASGGTSTVTFTVTNPNTAAQTALTFADTLPAGMTVANPNAATSTCGGTLTATAGSNSISISGGSVGASTTCTFSVNVTDSTAGSANNSATLSSSPGGTGSVAAAALTVVGPPTIAEAFSPTTVAPNVNSTVTFTLGNPAANTVSLTGVAFTDSLPSGLIVSNPSGATTNCTSGTLSANAGGSAISLSGASIAAGATCTVTVSVKSAAIGSYPNPTGTVSSTNGGTGTTATATLTVNVTPTKVIFSSVPPSTLTAGGNAGTISAALEDGSNNIATNNTGTAVTLMVTGPSGYSQTYPGTTTNGVATYNLSSVPLTVAGTYTYTASSSGLTSAVVSETVNAGATATITIAGVTNELVPAVSQTATVKAIDSYGNTVPGFTGTVTLSSSDTSATFSPASYTYTASDAGSHAFTVAFNTAGTFTLTASTGSVTGGIGGIVIQDAIWLINTNDTLVRLNDGGAQSLTAGSAATASTYGAIAFDNTGNVWAVANAVSSVMKYSATGSAASVAGASAAGISLPTSIAIDGLGQVWVANGGNSISVLTNAGAAVSPSTGYQGGTNSPLSSPSGIVIDNTGSVWVSNRGNNTVTKFFGAAAPVVTPIVTGTTNNTLGKLP